MWFQGVRAIKVSPEDKNSGMAKHMSECQDVCDLLRSFLCLENGNGDVLMCAA